jgi:hypothetical protein
VSTTQITTRHASYPLYEQEVVQRWRSLPPGCLLPLHDGRTWRLLFGGRPGGSAGPDVCDAVLQNAMALEQRYIGDIEFHVRSSEWATHQHHLDQRYNRVILHVVLFCDDPYPTQRQEGLSIPVCSLYDIIPERPQPSLLPENRWPCHRVMPLLSERERLSMFKQAGLLRFEQKTHAFVEQLHSSGPLASPTLQKSYDACLFPALGEALGYGRDRAFFRAASLSLLLQHFEQGADKYLALAQNDTEKVPEPLGRALHPPPLDAARLRALRLMARWLETGVWQTFSHLLMPGIDTQKRESLPLLRSTLQALGLSLARTDILLCNVIFPFAAAVATLEQNAALFTRVQHLYQAHPGLPSNCVTRMMCAQLKLEREPRGSCQQQGLHYIYQQTCREKQCATCIAGRWSV